MGPLLGQEKSPPHVKGKSYELWFKLWSYGGRRV